MRIRTSWTAARLEWKRTEKVEGQDPVVRERGTMKLLRTFGLLVVTLLIASPAFAAEGGGDGASAGLIAIGAGIGLGIAAFGAGMGQGRAAAAAMESIGRNPNAADRIFTPLIVSLALMEALALYALVVAFTLAGKIPAVG